MSEDNPVIRCQRMVRWCIRLTRLTLVCEVIRYRLVQVRQNQKKKKKKKWPGWQTCCSCRSECWSLVSLVWSGKHALVCWLQCSCQAVWTKPFPFRRRIVRVFQNIRQRREYGKFVRVLVCSSITALKTATCNFLPEQEVLTRTKWVYFCLFRRFSRDSHTSESITTYVTFVYSVFSLVCVKFSNFLCSLYFLSLKFLTKLASKSGMNLIGW